MFPLRSYFQERLSVGVWTGTLVKLNYGLNLIENFSLLGTLSSSSNYGFFSCSTPREQTQDNFNYSFSLKGAPPFMKAHF